MQPSTKSGVIIPPGYRPLLGVKETERGIKGFKDFFELNLATELNLSRVTAPLFVQGGTGINDDLNGVELPVAFPVKGIPGVRAEIVQSLAKWKRMQLAELGFAPGYGLYTDMNAIRPDEVLDNTHSLYVDQWDWERVITPAERNLAFLKKIVRKIYSIFKRTEHFISEQYPGILWNPVLELAFELSSMGIRVDKAALLRQLEIRGCLARRELYWHRRLLQDQMPLSIGGGIGQSRLCMYFLRKAHVGEIQASLWPEAMLTECRQNNVPLL